VISPLDQSAYFILYKPLLQNLQDGEAAIFLTHLYSFSKALEKKDLLLDGGWFFQTGQRVEEDLGLSVYKQGRIIDLLKDERCIEVRNFGRPCKRYFRLNLEVIDRLLSESRAPRAERVSDPKRVSFYEELNRSLTQSKEYDATVKTGNMKPETYRTLFVIHKAFEISRPSDPPPTWAEKEVGFVLRWLQEGELDLFRLAKAACKLFTSMREVKIHTMTLKNVQRLYNNMAETPPKVQEFNLQYFQERSSEFLDSALEFIRR
jgi:hypothetical protein